MNSFPLGVYSLLSLVCFTSAYAQHTDSTTDATPAKPHNVLLFVPDGLRSVIVNSVTAPTMAKLASQGVTFLNSHSLFPTFTTPNASAMSTGHYLGDTGDFSNIIFSGFPVKSSQGTLTPFLEDDAVLGEMDSHFSGNYIHEKSLMDLARENGFSTAVIGKLGPALIWDHTDRSGSPTIIVDDMTAPQESMDRIPLSKEMREALRNAGIPERATERGLNHNSMTLVSNRAQQDYFTNVATQTVLPFFKNRQKPFFMVFWSRDPDGTQHNQGDSPDKLVPGINGPTSLDAIKNADGDLARLIQSLKDLGLYDTTDILISADHGFSTISKESHTSTAVEGDPGHEELSSGFVAIDIAHELHLPLFDPDHGLIGQDQDHPEVVVAENGGSDLIYVKGGDKALSQKVIDILLKQDYVSGVFVNDALGAMPGTLKMSSINLVGTALTPEPTLVVNFRSYVSNTDSHQEEDPLKWTALVADTPLLEGQGQHGSFSRADTKNFMAAAGPDFKTGFTDPAPVSNADIGQTIAHLLAIQPSQVGSLIGRPITEAFPGGTVPEFESKTAISDPAPNGVRTILNYQVLGGIEYFDAAGFEGKTVGLKVPDNLIEPPKN